MKNFYIAVDFDGTIAKHEFPDIGDPVPYAIEWLNLYQKYGAKLILWTVRSDNQPNYGDVLTNAVQWSLKHDLLFDFINEHPEQDFSNSPKVHANIFIDDAAIGCPLIRELGKRPYVDWRHIGPAVLELIPKDLK